MNEIDLGYLNEKQIIEILKFMNNKTFNVYATILNTRIENQYSITLRFENKKEKDQFDFSSGMLVERLKELEK